MSGRRTDNNGRILKPGESQRKDLTYMFRYTGQTGKRQYVYARSLKELREKEREIKNALQDGLDYSSGNILTYDLVTGFLATKSDITETTKDSYHDAIQRLNETALGRMRARDVKKYDVTQWVQALHKKGLSYNSISVTMQIAKSAFAETMEDDVISKNSFSFKLTSIIERDEKKQAILPSELEAEFLTAIREDRIGKRYYNDVILLLDTGMRIGELYGLTKSDVDLPNRRLRVSHQVVFPRNSLEQRHIFPPKSKTGNRWIPLSDRAIEAMQSLIEQQSLRKMNAMLDGYTGFLFVDHDGYPRRGRTLNFAISATIKRYNKAHNTELPALTAHCFQHTFCTRMVAKGVDIKSLQYVLGHSKVELLLDKYAHVEYDIVEHAILTASNSTPNLHQKTAYR